MVLGLANVISNMNVQVVHFSGMCMLKHFNGSEAGYCNKQIIMYMLYISLVKVTTKLKV